ncbi:oligosaccharide repeat unit polymerase [bacterium]|nr:oligosaccharide repeat unit polymerase [bacterium]
MPSAVPHRHRYHPRQLKGRAEANQLTPSWPGTLVLLGCLLAASLFDVDEAEGVTATLKLQAIIVGLGLALSAAFDFQKGLRNLVRVDVVSLTALYFLSYVEFLFPQPHFDAVSSGYDVMKASQMVLLGMGSLAVARHLNLRKSEFLPATARGQQRMSLTVKQWLALLWIFAILGYAHMLIAVKFDVTKMVEAMMAPRFSQPWQRGRLGGWGSLLTELALFFYVIPPIYGILFAKRKSMRPLAFAGATGVVLFTLFYGYSSGTRNIFAAFIAGGFGAYLLVQPKLKIEQLIVVGVLGGSLLYLATNQMLHFRQIGLSRYLEHGAKGTVYEEYKNGEEASFFVDANLLNMGLMMSTVPSRHEYTGWDLPYNALIRPVPRAIWSGKPEGLKLSIEDAAGMAGLTLAVTFVGEAYLSGGAFGVVLAGLFFGSIFGLWNSAFRGRWSPFSQLVYVAGFYPAAISMRSLMSFTTAVLPIIGLIVISTVLAKNKTVAKSVSRKSSRAGHQEPEVLSVDANSMTSEKSEV